MFYSHFFPLLFLRLFLFIFSIVFFPLFFSCLFRLLVLATFGSPSGEKVDFRTNLSLNFFSFLLPFFFQWKRGAGTKLFVRALEPNSVPALGLSPSLPKKETTDPTLSPLLPTLKKKEETNCPSTKKRNEQSPPPRGLDLSTFSTVLGLIHKWISTFKSFLQFYNVFVVSLF